MSRSRPAVMAAFFFPAWALASGAAETGGPSREEIATGIRNHLGGIRNCYERQLVRQPDLQGKIVSHFTIGLGGKVEETRIRNSTLRNGSVESCVADVIRGIRFPDPGDQIVEVNYPTPWPAAP